MLLSLLRDYGQSQINDLKKCVFSLPLGVHLDCLRYLWVNIDLFIYFNIFFTFNIFLISLIMCKGYALISSVMKFQFDNFFFIALMLF